MLVPLLLLYHSPNVSSLLCTDGLPCHSLCWLVPLVTLFPPLRFRFFFLFWALIRPAPPFPAPFGHRGRGVGSKGVAGGGGLELDLLLLPLLLLLLVPLSGLQVLQLEPCIVCT